MRTGMPAAPAIDGIHGMHAIPADHVPQALQPCVVRVLCALPMRHCRSKCAGDVQSQARLSACKDEWTI